MKQLRYIILLFSTLYLSFASAKDSPFDRIDPPFWYHGLGSGELQLIFQGNGIANYQVESGSADVAVLRTKPGQSGNHLIVYLDISSLQGPLTVPLTLKNGKKNKFEITYEILERHQGVERGIEQGDLMYLVFPDRFANGDPSNDRIAGMTDTQVNRDSMFYRHGGDIKGIIQHLDYIRDLGFNSIWVNPVIENDQPEESYHGYAATDVYRIDPRFGTNEDYLELAKACHDRDMKLVMDVVLNHWGNEHHLIKDLIDADWLNHWDDFQRTNYRATSLFDPYASEQDRRIMTDGWFDHHMPDLNQRNPDLARYLIQNHLWWVEYAGIDAIRIDTYAYPDQDFMRQWNEALLKDFPDLSLFAETWVHGTPVQAWFVGDTGVNKDYNNSLGSVTDFQLYYAINKALTEPFGWTEGVSRIYYTLAKDILYKEPDKLVTFLDNHDLSRFYSMIGEDMRKFKMGVAFLYTTRGIPCVYYGTEILMKNFADPDGKVREDFPGGWPNDATNKFKRSGRTDQEVEAFEFMRQLGQWRQGNELLSNGKLMQFVPKDGVYTYFRYTDDRCLMMIMNPQEKEVNIDLSRFRERLDGYGYGIEVTTGREIILRDLSSIAPVSFLLVEMSR